MGQKSQIACCVEQRSSQEKHGGKSVKSYNSHMESKKKNLIEKHRSCDINFNQYNILVPTCPSNATTAKFGTCEILANFFP